MIVRFFPRARSASTRVVVPAGLRLLAVGVLLAGCAPTSDREEPEGRQGAEAEGRSEVRPGPVDRLPDTPSGTFLARALDHHDPDRVWWTRPIRLTWDSSRPGGERRRAEVMIDNGRGAMELEMEFRGHRLEFRSRGSEGRALVDGSEEIPPEVRRHLRLDREGGMYWRNYFLFLVGMPMKLSDPGLQLRPEVERTVFEGREVVVVRAEYPTEDGYPHWDFFFDPETAELVGTRFFREGPEADGEWIVMEGSVEAAGLRIPRVRRWHRNDDGTHLGTDEVTALEVVSSGA